MILCFSSLAYYFRTNYYLNYTLLYKLNGEQYMDSDQRSWYDSIKVRLIPQALWPICLPKWGGEWIFILQRSIKSLKWYWQCRLRSRIGRVIGNRLYWKVKYWRLNLHKNKIVNSADNGWHKILKQENKS